MKFKMRGKRFWITTAAVAALLILVIGTVAIRNGDGNAELVTVVRRDLVETVDVAGTVEAATVSDLGFEVSGIVQSVLVNVDDTVPAGAPLVTLTLGTLSAELQSAEAAVAIKRARTENTTINLNAIQEQQDTLVASALRNLLSSDLVATPETDSLTLTPPTITGLYDGPAGRYKVRVASTVVANKYDLVVLDLEHVLGTRINDNKATPFGTRGLFITFPSGPELYRDTTWYVNIPNTESASYAENYNSYQKALRERDRALEEAKAELRATNNESVAAGELAQAQAEVARIQAEINKRILRAPFTGTITARTIDPGESLGANTPVISLISNNDFGVEVDFPEIDSINVRVGDQARVSFDALPDNPPLPATVLSINRAETIVDGIPVYEARLVFTEDHEFIRSGMTTTVTVTTNSREDVLAIPARALLFREDGSPYVRTKTDGEEREIDVTTGMRGSDGFIEVVSGVSEGDTVLITRT